MEKISVLPFSPVWQEAIAGYMLQNYPFFLRCKAFLSSSWFVDPHVSNIVKQMIELHDSLPTPRPLKPDELQECFVMRHPDKKTQDLYWNKLKLCSLAMDRVGLDILSRDMTAWIRLTLFRESMIEAEQLYNKQDHTKARIWLKEKLQTIEQTSFENDQSIDFSNPEKFVKTLNERFSHCLTLGHPLFDELLIKNASKTPEEQRIPSHLNTLTRGGLAPGDTTIVMGASNAGKTSFLISTICPNILLKKYVLLITHEGNPDDIHLRHLECLTGLDGTKISSMNVEQVNGNKDKILAASKILSKQLKYYSYNKPDDMYVESIIALIRNEQEQKIAQDGVGYDLLVVDYPGLLRSKQYTFKKSSSWEEKTYVYTQFMNCARYYKLHTILPVQTNREGFKVNRGDANRMLDQDDVAEAFGIMQNADNVITLNRSPMDAANNVIRFYIAKCRSDGQKHATFVSHTNLAICRTHWVDYKGMEFPVGQEPTDNIIAMHFGVTQGAGSQPVQPVNLNNFPNFQPPNNNGL